MLFALLTCISPLTLIADQPGKPASPGALYYGKSLSEWTGGLKHSDPEVRAQVAQVLGRIGLKDKEIVQSLIGVLQDDNVKVRHAAVHALEQIGGTAGTAIPDLLKLLKDKDASVREAVCKALQKVESSGHVRSVNRLVLPLLNCLSDPSAQVRKAAAVTLGSFSLLAPNPIVTMALQNLLQSEETSDRVAGAEAFAWIAQEPDGHATLPLLRPLLKDKSLAVRIHAAVAIQKITLSDQGTYPVLQEGLTAESTEIRALAIKTLGTLRLRSEELVPEFRKLLKDPETEVRAEAAQALYYLDREILLAAPVMLEALFTDNPNQQQTGFYFLQAELQRLPTQIQNRLKLMLWDKDPHRAQMAAVLLDLAQKKDRKTISLLLTRALDSESPLLRQWASAILMNGRSLPEGKTGLEKAGQHRDPIVRMFGSLGLYLNGDKPAEKALPIFFEALQAPDEDLRILAGHVLAHLKPEDFPEMIKFIKEGDSQLIRSQAIAVFRDVRSGINPQFSSIRKLAVPALIQALQDEHFNVRRWAARVLGDLGPIASKAVPRLIPLLKDKDPLLRMWAARALGLIGSDARACAPALIQALQDPSINVRAHAATSLEKLRISDKAATPLLVKGTKSPDESLRAASLRTLIAMSTEQETLKPIVRSHLQNPHPETQLEALTALQKKPELANASLEQVTALLQSSHPLVRSEAARTVWQLTMQSKLVLPTLRKALRSDEATNYERFIVLRTLLTMKEDAADAIPELIELTKKEEKPEARAAVSTLIAIDPEGSKVIPALAELLKSKRSTDFRSGLIEPLSGYGKKVVPAMMGLLKEEDEKTITMASLVLGRVGPEAKSALPALKNLKSHKSELVQRVVELVIQRIEPRDVPPPPNNNTKAGEGRTVILGKLKSDVPTDWVRKPVTGLRHAEFELPGADGKATLVVYRGFGGSADANIKRWLGQVTPPEGKTIKDVSRIVEAKYGSLQGKRLEVIGTLRDPSGKPMRGQMMVGLHLEGPDKVIYHLKLTGPEATVRKHLKAFDQWIQGFK